MSARGRQLGILAALVLAIVLPFLVGGYRVFQLTMVLDYAIAVFGANILTGYNGQIALGNGAFYALGAYTTAILMTHAAMPYWATIPIAAAVCFVAGFLFGLPALRLEGPYLALATFALAVATPQLLKFDGIEGWTGGVQGILIDKPDPPGFLPVDSDTYLYLFCLAVTVLMFVLGANLLRGRTGRAILAIRDHPIAASGMGIDIALYKSLTFGVSALITGVAGSLGALIAQFVSPDSFTLFLSISFIVGVVVGGVATVSGAFFGAIFIEFVPPLADQISKAAPWAVYGALLIFCVYVMPGGVVGLLRWAGRALSRNAPKTAPIGRARLIP
jgi:branched-chain amino acid transport system permease protein